MNRPTRGRQIFALPGLTVALCALGIGATSHAKRSGEESPGIACLMYHRFVTPDEFSRLPRDQRCYCVSTQRFEAQLQWLKNNSFQSISLSETLDCIRGERSLLGRRVLITIDDGCRSILTHAAPLLEKYGFHAVIFVTTDPSAEVFHEQRPDPQLSVSELRSLDPDVFEFGSHGITHQPLTELSNDQLECELRESRRTLEAWAGQSVRTLAVPHGCYNKRVQQAVQSAGYEMMFTSEFGIIEAGCDVFRLPRRTIAGTCNLRRFELLMSR